MYFNTNAKIKVQNDMFSLLPFIEKRTRVKYVFTYIGGTSGKESACQCRRQKRRRFVCIWVRSLGGGEPLEESMATHSSILAWRIPMDRGVWQVAVHGVSKSQTLLSN